MQDCSVIPNRGKPAEPTDPFGYPSPVIIFLDESGDMGFDFRKGKTSKKFVITLLVCRDNAAKGFKTAIRRTITKKLNRGRGQKSPLNELKGSKTSFAVKRYFWKQCPREGWNLYAVALNKDRVDEHLRTLTGRKKLYNFLAAFIIEKLKLDKIRPEAVTLTVDKSKNKKEIQDFNQYLENQLQARLPLQTPLNITHEQSTDNPGLQAVDLFCWGIFRKYEFGCLEWYRLFHRKIRFQTEYLRPKK